MLVAVNLLVSMESGCLEKNQLLLDSIVEASCNGGSALPDLNLDEDTVRGRELNDTGLKEGIIPVGALKRASMNKNLQTLEESSTMHLMKEIQELPVSTDPKDSVTQSAMLCAPSTMRSYRNEAGGNAETRKDQKGSHVRLNIPHVSPTATLSALSQMLWEDVLRQAKKSATLYGGKVDIVLSQRKIQRAENMLRAAFIEFYRGLGFLKNYRSCY
jgi:hypothetical protein